MTLVIRCAAAICSLALCSLALAAGAAAQPQEDAFARQRDSEAKNAESTGFSVAFADARRTFHPGEAIPLTFTFHRHDVSPFNYEHCQGLGLADVVFEHADGLVDPQADMWNNGVDNVPCGILSGVVGGALRPDGTSDARPIEFRVHLNQAVRFDRPGTYRFYIRSRHRFLGNRGDALLPPLISGVLRFDIVERDPEWEAKTLDHAVRVLASPGDETAVKEAARTIAYLGTPGAIDEMVRRYRDDSLAFFWRRGLFGARDRAAVVARMEHELDVPDCSISPRFIRDLALLGLTHRLATRPIPRSQYNATVRDYSRRHAGAVAAARHGRAR